MFLPLSLTACFQREHLTRSHIFTTQSYERAFLRSLYEHVRQGELDVAIESCRQSDQSWRAASLSGGQPWSDPLLGPEQGAADDDDAMVGTGALERVVKGNANRRLWKSMCRKLAGSVRLSAAEASYRL